MNTQRDIRKEAVAFDCEGSRLIGVLHRPVTPATTGVVLIVGGPQYRVGSHRQFVLLGDELASSGVACLRFDYRGMGDSEGPAHTFENVSEDIRCAIDELVRRVPEISRIVLWGLCDAASASMFCASSDRRICGIVVLNPWARTEEGLARSYLKHYYLRRLFDPQAWSSILRERKSPVRILRSIATMASSALSGRKQREASGAASTLPERMAVSLDRFRGSVLLILSGDDITAREFVDATAASERWKTLLARDSLQRRELAEADHTFSRREWRDTVAAWTIEWVRGL
jgi:exosortase A-associated hydrolase 1